MRKREALLMKLRNMIGYGVGDVGAGIMWGMVGSYALVYMTDAVKLSPAILGTMLLVARVFDGVSDAFMGAIIDNTHTRLGKARPWYLASILPLVVIAVLLFNVPAQFSDAGKYAYFFVMYFLMTAVFYTVKDVSYNALPALVTDSTKDRIGLNIWRYLLSLSTGIVIGVATVPALNSMGGISDQSAWTRILFVYSLIALPTLVISGFSVKEMNVASKGAGEEKPKGIPFLKAFALTFQNRYFLLSLGGTLLGMIRMALGSANIYFAQYNAGNAELVGILTIASLLPMIVGMLLSPPLLSRFGMLKVKAVGGFVSLVGSIVAALLPGSFAMVVLGQCLIAFGMGPFVASGSAWLAYVIDYGEWKNGEMLTGTICSCNSVATKVGTGLGNAMIGWGLAIGGYMAANPVQAASALNAIKAVYLYIPVALSLLIFVLSLFQDLEEKMPQIKAEMANRSGGTEVAQ
jgi:GPH family glycoside/pentoside/hexuronide:cation symporter